MAAGKMHRRAVPSMALFLAVVLAIASVTAADDGRWRHGGGGGGYATEMTADYVIVGAGATSSPLAHRLARAGLNVLVLEAGIRRFDDPSIYETLGSMGLYSPIGEAPSNDPAYSWQHALLPDTGSYGARITIANGKTWGGGSMINTAIAVHGSRNSYDHDWPAAWNFDRMSPYLERVRRDVRPHRDTVKTNATRVFLEAAMGIAVEQQARTGDRPNFLVNLGTYPQPAVEPADGPVQLDYNDPASVNEVCAFSDYAFTFNRGPDGTFHRQSAGNTYLADDCVDGATGLGTDACPHLRVVSEAYVDRVLFECTRAVGVAYWRHGRLHAARARRLVVLSGGAYETPAVLQRSGVGNATYLAGLGIEPTVDNGHVGAHLMNDLSWSTLVRFVPTGAGTADDLADFVAGSTGLSPSNLNFYAGAFTDYHPMDPGRPPRPHLSLRKYQWFVISGALFFPSSIRDRLGVADATDASYVTFSLDDIRLSVRGKVELGTADPQSALRIFFDTLVDVADVPSMGDAAFWEHARPLLEPTISAVLAYDMLYQFYRRMGPVALERTNGTITVEMAYPPLDVASTLHDGIARHGADWWHYLVPARALGPAPTADQLAFVQVLDTARRLARTAIHADSHQCGSAQIGKALDDDLNVIGASHLKVADLSVVPFQPAGNPVWTAMALGLAAADIILDEARLDD